VRIATWNVGSLTGRSREVIDVMQRRKIGILCLQEIRWKGQGARELGEGYKLLYSGGTDKKNGVGVILDQEMKEKVVDVMRHSNRLMAVRLVIQGQVYNIVSGYAPQTGCTQEEKDSFHEDLEAVIRNIPATEHLVMGADMNGHVGTDINGYEGVHGGHGYGIRNEEGDRFLEMAQGLNLTIMNTYFKKPEEQKITYRSGTRSSQIDFIVVRNEDRKQVRDCKVIPGEAAVAQHRILVMDLIMNITHQRGNKVRQKERIRTWKLKDKNQRVEYAEKVRVRLAETEEMTWSKLSSMLEAAKQVCGTTKGQRRKERETWWWNEEVQTATKDKKTAFRNWQKDRQDNALKITYKAKRRQKTCGDSQR
jgi:hypothetical protein